MVSTLVDSQFLLGLRDRKLSIKVEWNHLMWISFWPTTCMWWNETILQQSLWFYGTCIFRCKFPYLFCLKEEVLVFFHSEKRAGKIIHFHCFMHIQVSTTFPLCLVSYFLFFVGDKRRQKFYSPGCCQTWLACM